MAITAYALSRLLKRKARKYNYQPLPAVGEGLHVRLLILPVQSAKTSKVKCSLKTHPLYQAPEYEAISYHWGNPQDQGEVVCDGQTIQVPRNVHDFLLRLCASGKERTLWIDSICINQSDDPEKSVQVGAMREIYSRAKRTLVWLGKESNNSTLGLTHANDIYHNYATKGKPENKRCLSSLSKYWGLAIWDGRLKALFDVFEREYFQRAWVVQELSVSTEVIVTCGKMVIGWQNLLIAMVYYSETCPWISDFYKEFQNMNFALSFIRTYNDVQNNVQLPYWQTLNRWRRQLASDPRDKVYAFYGLNCYQSFRTFGIEPRYDVSVEQLYTSMAISTLCKVTDLNFLGIPKKKQNMRIPSWSHDWNDSEEPCFGLLLLETDTGRLGEAVYNATLSSICRPSFDANGCELLLEGHIVDKVSQLSNTYVVMRNKGMHTIKYLAKYLRQRQKHFRECETVLGVNTRRRYPTGEKMSEVGWQVYTAAASGNDKQLVRERWLPFERRQRYWRVLHKFKLDGFLAVWILVVVIGRLFRLLGIQDPEQQFHAWTLAMRGRKAGRTEREYAGLLPGIAEVGDRIVLFRGGRLPFVVRPRGTKWELIGDCYIHGPITNGKEWDKTKCETLHIV